MTKQDLVDKIAEATGLNKKDSTTALNATLDVIKDTLVAGDKIQLIGFGTFEVHERAARTGRNPQTGETMTIAASKAPAFKAGKALKDAVNPAPKAKPEAKAKKKKK